MQIFYNDFFVQYPGWAFYCAIISVVLGFVCASISIKAESGNMNANVIRRIERGEKLLCVP